MTRRYRSKKSNKKSVRANVRLEEPHLEEEHLEQVQQAQQVRLEKTPNVHKNTGGRPKNPVWKHFKAGKETSSGHWPATCNYCDVYWGKGVVYKMETHLASHCSQVPRQVLRYYINLVEENDKEVKGSNKKRKLDSYGQLKITDSFKNAEMNEDHEKHITRALVKAFALCGISWHIIENPFFIDALQQLNPAYNPPSREVFVNRHFETELVKVNKRIFDELQHEKHLTLGKIVLFYITILIIL